MGFLTKLLGMEAETTEITSQEGISALFDSFNREHVELQLSYLPLHLKQLSAITHLSDEQMTLSITSRETGEQSHDIPISSFIACTVHHHGSTLKFEGKLIDSSSDSYTLSYPEKVQSIRCREGYRTSLFPDSGFALQFQLEPNCDIKSTLLDLSFSGTRLRLLEDRSAQLSTLHHIHEAKLLFPDQSEIPVTLELRHYHYEKESDSTIIGFRFIELPIKDQQQIIEHLTAHRSRCK